MALGPFARVAAQAAVLVVSIMSRALPAAYAAALNKARKDGVQATAEITKKGMKRSEALEILNLTDVEATPEAIRKQYDRYFAANSVEKGGSFYLQSKVYRARELLDEYIEEKRQEDLMKRKENADSGGSGGSDDKDDTTTRTKS